MISSLPKLSYSYNALEPFIDAKTMEIHHTKHHQGYIDKLNVVLEKYPELQNQKLETLIRGIKNLNMAEPDKIMLKNNGGGHLNHSLFWEIMSPKKNIDGKLFLEIEKTFENIENFKKLFSQAAISHFGSGWAWLVRTKKNELAVYSLSNQDSPLLKNDTPIIGLDVWEHAYYLRYQNRRAEYIENWWNVLTLL